MRLSGICVAILGPDGSGKSSVIDQLVPMLAPEFRGIQRLHLRPRVFSGSAAGQRTNTDPHGQALRGPLASSAKLLFLWADYSIGYFVRVRPALTRSSLVLFDRYYYDLLVDSRRFRYGGPAWLLKLIGRLIPRPDLLLILDAPAEVLQSRKQEVSPEESARQAALYRALATSPALGDCTVLIDATQPLNDVVHRCLDASLDVLHRRKP
jgi:thymidylate kinase